MPTKRYMSTKTTMLYLDVSRSTLWRLVKGGVIPPPLRLSNGTVRYDKTSIDQWLENKMPTN